MEKQDEIGGDTTKIRQAAQAIINRWDDPKWEWNKHGHTAGLIADLRNALDASPPIVGEPVAMIHNSYDASVSCSKCGTVGGFSMYDDLDWAKFCPGCGGVISEQVSSKGERTPHPLYLAQAPQSSPAPSVIEADDAMAEEEQFIAPHSGMWEFVGCVRIYLKEGDTLGVRAAKASRPSVTAPHGVTVDDDWIDEVAHKWAVSQWTDREDMQDQRMTEFGHAVRILRFALLTK